MIIIEKCILCKVDGKELGLVPVYNKYTKEDPTGVSSGLKRNYTILQCSDCKLFWVKDIDDDYEKMYVEEYWQSHMSMRGWPRIETDERIQNDIKYANLRAPEIVKFTKGGNALDIACSTGTMLKLFKDMGFGPNIHGVEVNQGAAKQAQDFSGCYVYPKALTGDEKEIPNNHYDFITALDVLEHLTDPLAQAKIWVKKLKLGGIIWIECPDAGCSNCLVNPVAKQKGIADELLWDYVIPYEHTFYYKQEHVKKIFMKYGCAPLYSNTQWTTDRMRCVFQRVF